MRNSVIRIAIFLICTMKIGIASTQKELRKYELTPVAKGISNILYIQNSQRAFFVMQTAGVLNVGVADMVNMGKFYELRFKHITDYHAVRTYSYTKTGEESDKDLYVYIMDVDGDTLPIDSITLGKEDDYELSNKKGILAEKEYCRFPISAKNKLSHLTLPGLYDLFGHDVIFHLPEEGMNTINIYLNIPNEFYMRDPSTIESIIAEEGKVIKVSYDDDKIVEFKTKKGESDPEYIRNVEDEKISWENNIWNRPFKKRK